MNLYSQLHRLESRLGVFTKFLEGIMGVLILCVVIIHGVGVFVGLDFTQIFNNADYFAKFLESAYAVLIGVEFVKMLFMHTTESVINLVTIAIARQFILEHCTPLENLITVGAFVLLFIIRKYLLQSKHKAESNEIL